MNVLNDCAETLEQVCDGMQCDDKVEVIQGVANLLRECAEIADDKSYEFYPKSLLFS